VEILALVLAALVVLSMPVFALTRRGGHRDADVARRPTTVLLGRWIRDWLMWAAGPIERALVRSGVSPDALNLAGVACGLAAGILYARGEQPWGGWLVLLGGLADVLDGRIARARNVVSERGAFLDSTLDRFTETFAFLGLVVFYTGRPWEGLANASALAGSLLVSYARARGEAHGVSMKGGLMQRAERLVLLALASLLDPWGARLTGTSPGTPLAIVLGVIALGSLGTAAYRTVAIARALGRPGGPPGR
jgi:phosphatidylglycerophosphate synthase